MSRTAAGMVLAALAALTGPAQDAVHELAGGELVEGRAGQREEGVLLRTPFGWREVPEQDYRGLAAFPLEKLEERYRREHAELHERDREGHLRLAQWCFAMGYLSGALIELNALLRIDVHDSWARQRCTAIARTYRVHAAEGSAQGGDQRNLSDHLFEDLARRDNVGAVVAAEKARQLLPDDLVARAAMKALKGGKARVRWLGAHLLGDIGEHAGRIRELYLRGLQDGSPAVRREAVRSLRPVADEDIARLFAKELRNPEPMLRVRAAQALGELGEPSAAAPLVSALADAWSPHRSYAAFTTQTAYVKDYDVEVAQTAFIADPIVDVVQDGAILEAGLISVSVERHVYHRALKRLTGLDLGTLPRPWKQWLEQQRQPDEQERKEPR